MGTAGDTGSSDSDEDGGGGGGQDRTRGPARGVPVPEVSIPTATVGILNTANSGHSRGKDLRPAVRMYTRYNGERKTLKAERRTLSNEAVRVFQLDPASRTGRISRSSDLYDLYCHGCHVPALGVGRDIVVPREDIH